MVEIEKKYPLKPEMRAQIVSSLEEIGAEFVRDDFEENTIYGGGELERTASIVRIRRTQARAILTYKRRIENASDAKHQIEFESEISDADAVSKILVELNLTPKIVYEKKRSTWKLRSVEVLLDELPFGLFMEIEGSVTGIKEAEMLLDIDGLETEQETYPRLTARHGTNVDGVIESRFD
jgi:adenylate cyclase, class 2